MGKIINDLEGFFPKVCNLTSTTIKHKRVSVAIVCTPLSSRGGVGWDGGFGHDRIPNFRGWLFVKRVVTFFKEWWEGGCSFYIKNKLK